MWHGNGIATMRVALALSAHTPRVQLSVYNVSACWRSELGWDTPSRYLASAGTPANLILSLSWHGGPESCPLMDLQMIMLKGLCMA